MTAEEIQKQLFDMLAEADRGEEDELFGDEGEFFGGDDIEEDEFFSGGTEEGEETQPVEQPKQVEKPVEPYRPVEKPVEQPKPVEPSRPVEQPKPVEPYRPVEQPKRDPLAPSFPSSIKKPEPQAPEDDEIDEVSLKKTRPKSDFIENPDGTTTYKGWGTAKKSEQKSKLKQAPKQEPVLDIETFQKCLRDTAELMKMENNSMRTFEKSDDMQDRIVKQMLKSEPPLQCSNPAMYKKNTATFKGKPFEYKVLKRDAQWGKAFMKASTMNDSITNLENLQEKIIVDLKIMYGSLSRITEIAVISGMLIINGTQYYPVCNDQEFLDALPFDCAEYLKEGLIAEIFDFGYLYSMPYLTTLKIDSLDFCVKRFSIDIGLEPKTFKPEQVYKKFRHLKYFEVGDYITDSITKGKDNVRLQRDIEENTRFADFYDGYINSSSKAITSWSVDCLKTYATNRGSKGFLRYTCGTVARGIGVVASGIGTVGVMATGGVLKAGVRALKRAFNSVEGD